MSAKKIFSRYQTVLVCMLLVGAVLVVFGRVNRHEFILLDDNDYVTQNKHVQEGLNGSSIKWAFTTFHASNWHPLTWLSLMLDYELIGLQPFGFHVINLLFHSANTILLFLLLKNITGFLLRSGFVALVFGIHPLHVESVAWVAERKDVLSTLFWLLTMWAYSGYAKRGGTVRYFIVIVFFVLGLMAKPMLVTLPFVLLLLDYWPLGRLEFRKDHDRQQAKLGLRRVMLEKIPLLLLAIGSALMTVIAQRSGGAVIALGKVDFWWRAKNAVVSCAAYIYKMFVPIRLAVFYPNMSPPALKEVILSGLLLMSITVGVILLARRRRYLVTGWFWFLGTLVPVIGIVQVGSQAMADRYSYVPLIGLFIILAWFVPDMLAGRRYKKVVIGVMVVGVVVSMGVIARRQVGRWRDTITLFEHAVSVTEDNFVAHSMLSNAYGRSGRIDKCIEHGEEALKIYPKYTLAYYNLGMGYYSQRNYKKAIEQWEQVLRLKNDFKEVNFNIGVAYEVIGEPKKAIEYFSKELINNSGHKSARQKLANLLAKYPHLNE
jgi:tetratricopeptide (TPR) repeat protein